MITFELNQIINGWRWLHRINLILQTYDFGLLFGISFFEFLVSITKQISFLKIFDVFGVFLLHQLAFANNIFDQFSIRSDKAAEIIFSLRGLRLCKSKICIRI